MKLQFYYVMEVCWNHIECILIFQENQMNCWMLKLTYSSLKTPKTVNFKIGLNEYVKHINNLKEKILIWTRIRTRISSSTYWRYNH